MNKIILLSKKDELPKGAFDFACMLNEQERILLTGIFLPRVDYRESLLVYSYGWSVPVPFEPESEETLDNQGTTDFIRLSELNGIEYRVHEKGFEDVGKELAVETRFGDLLLIGNEGYDESLEEVIYGEYKDKAVHAAECPVILVPHHFNKPESVILAYDGSASSVYAIRQFAALMPELTKLETLLVFINTDEETDFPHKPYLEELVGRHFSDLTFLKLDIDPQKYFTTWLADRKNSMLVTGAQGRSGLSQLFRKSFVREILDEQMLPVFIAHR